MTLPAAPQRWSWRLGVLLVVAGSALGGYVAWQVWGTNLVAQRTHRALVAEVERRWSEGDVRVAGVLTQHGRVSAVVRIPRFGDAYAIPVLEGTSERALAAGFGHFSAGADAGGRGNFALAGHRVTHGEPLRSMPSLRIGDEVIVETGGWTYTYVLDTDGDALTVPLTATWVLDDRPDDPAGESQPGHNVALRILTLVTCSELFHTDDRLVAFGHLTSAEPRSD